jgi:hypothetical protein
MPTPEDAELFLKFGPLFEPEPDDESLLTRKPLLAHYTSIQKAHKILTSDELWFSNPLVMNDLEEVRFSVNEGYRRIYESPLVADACQTPERVRKFRENLAYNYNQLGNTHIHDTYVLCLSEHDNDDQDGLLSMWRGYGGNGSGAAIVFDTAKLGDPIQSSALIVGKVRYGTQKERLDWIDKLIQRFAALLRGADLPDEKLYIATYAVFTRLSYYALFSKHRGFHEEREWRVAYLPERDISKALASMCTYEVGPRGVEPKLKLKVQGIEGQTNKGLSLASIIDRILLGPSVSSPVAMSSFLRMLDIAGKSELKGRVRASGIPFRYFPG